ncbi:hypothetical protein [Rhizobium leguminosarum]|uniref:hypothetical protein n=1 Tax=Rhizobium leguminosarum TaxID=384 RepID=UPI002E1134ED|nr:hypothetical protein U8Q02_40175 [Rhizobium leguminosarum]
MGKKKTFGRASKYVLLDWAQAAGIDVSSYDETYFYGSLVIDGVKRQIRCGSEHDRLEICDGGRFDRWANSCGAVRRFPHTQEEFMASLQELCAIPLSVIAAEREVLLA